MYAQPVRGLAAGFATSGATPLTLKETLQAFDVPILSQEAVYAHKRELSKSFSPVRYVLAHFFSWCSLFAVADAIDRASNYRASDAIIYSYLGFVVIATATGIAGMYSYSLEFAVGLIPLSCVFALALVTGASSEDLRRVTRWRRSSLYRYDRTPGANPITLRLRERATRVHELTGSRIMIDSYNTDPFLVAVRGWGPWKEEATIGAWETGVPELDRL